ncbi:arylamine N-acetyltransferase [Chelativorans sp.]|uniref:arylamine N-acetyltransferase family protein n=1 Tax=Chelativorans sp. TaxID=2203393 RepID=UPI002811841E|nr:arylamine N-acetyltransferase [Chelativorans sp.]
MAGEETTIDLEAYFRRIGYEGPREPTLETLSALHLLHPLAIAFENLDPLLQQPVNLDLPSLQRKLVHSGRGGYCYEQNTLFDAVLRALGFRVSGLAARVLWGREDLPVTPRTHMLLRIELSEGTYVADVGFGRITLTAPLRLESGIEQPTPHEISRLDPEGSMWVMKAKIGEEWRALYRFDLEEQFPADYEIFNYFVSTNPGSLFVHSLMAARPTPDGGRYALFNGRLSIHGVRGINGPRELDSAEEIETVLREIFGIDIPDSTALAEALRRETIV